jgi:CHAD domain-containing protein
MSGREREIKLGAPLGFRMPDLTGPTGELTSGPPETIELDATYYDTDDLRLARSGVSFRYRNDEGWVVKTPNAAPSDDGMFDRTEHGFPGSNGEPPEAAVDLLRAIIRTKPINPVARLHTTRRSTRIYGLDGAPVGEVTDDDVEVLDGDHLVDRFRELEIELTDGVPTDRVDDIVGRLRAAGARAPEMLSKIVRALGPRAQDPPDLVCNELGGDAPIEDVVRNALSESIAKLVEHDPGVRSGADPEDIHQARVATRRLRSHLRTFRSLLHELWANELRDELKWLGEQLGAVLDAEVLKERLDAKIERLPAVDRVDARRLIARLDDDRERARAALLEAIESDRYLELLERLVTAAQRPHFVLRVDGEEDREILRNLVRRPWGHLEAAVQALDDDPADEALHNIRIRAKRARYAAEAAAPVFGKPARRLARAITEVQDVLGEHQDAVVATGWLRCTAADAGTESAGFVAGQLAALERDDAAKARAAWADTWREASRKRHRTWL